MAIPPKILAFAGSTRTESFNKKLVNIAVNGARDAGGGVTLIDLRDYPLPLFDGDLEEREGLPENARKLKQLFLAHDGLLISAPEYNSGISGVLKNTIDWVSRSEGDEDDLAGFVGKVAAIMSASPGALGGLRGLLQVRSILTNIHVLVLCDQVTVSRAHEAFSADGSLKDAKKQAAVEKHAATLVQTLRKLKA
ncbi:MAG TPA: NAD(P)H-dependent oxidoreductase [Verrucomicrobiae bacterium]|nr:NAD(P)H-dependent oxidoreductase [Verrucomicrobiae bacterium]